MNKLEAKTKIKERDGYKYSLNPFEGYKYRYMIRYELHSDEIYHNITIYSDNRSPEWVNQLFSYVLRKKHRANLKYSDNYIVHRASKEQDDRLSDFLDSLEVFSK